MALSLLRIYTTINPKLSHICISALRNLMRFIDVRTTKAQTSVRVRAVSSELYTVWKQSKPDTRYWISSPSS